MTSIGNWVSLSVDCVRNISCGLDKQAERTILSGYFPISTVAQLSTEQNVRNMIATRFSQFSHVHRGIYDSLVTNPDKFSVLNGGITIVAEDYKNDETKKCLHLRNASIINGAQTRGVIEYYLQENRDELLNDAFVRFEVIVSKDKDLISEVSVARNLQNEVKFLSIMGRTEVLADLKSSMLRYNPEWEISVSETDKGKIDTQTLIQVITAFTPKSLTRSISHVLVKDGVNVEIPHAPLPAQAYSLMKCLRAYDLTYEYRDSVRSDLYKFYIDIAPKAWDLYTHWMSSEEWRCDGCRIKSILKKRGDQILGVKVPDGIMLPFMHGLSAFCELKNGTWTVPVPIPSHFDFERYIIYTSNIYKSDGKHDICVMGRNPSIYERLEEEVRNRKELSELQADNARLRNQLSHTNRIVA